VHLRFLVEQSLFVIGLEESLMPFLTKTEETYFRKINSAAGKKHLYFEKRNFAITLLHSSKIE
jgi:hypothetical protein